MEDPVDLKVEIKMASDPDLRRMLFPAEVVPFFQHDDPGVRSHAIDYFRGASDVGPLTADHYWECLDRFGDVDPALSFAVLMTELPQTDNSFDRLLQALAGDTPKMFSSHYQSAVYKLPLDRVVRDREKIFACPALDPRVGKHLESRLALLHESAASAWDRLIQYGNDAKDEYSSGIDGSISGSLVEAAARGGDEICEKALALLRRENITGEWTEIFAVRVLGAAKYEPAIPTLVSLFAIDTDVLREEANRALVRIGTPRVAEEILAFYPGKPWHVRLYAHSHISKIKRLESVDALLKLLEIERALQANPKFQDEEGNPLEDQILIEVTDLCSLAGLEESRKRIQEYPIDPELSDLRERLIATAIMRGISLPEESQWLTLRAEAEKRQKARAKSFERLFNISQKSKQQIGRRSAGSTLAAPPIGAQATRPIRNTAPKVGRNDPCICGSGKKFKKCCGK